MLYRLEIANFYSLRDRQVIDLRSSASSADAGGRLAPIWAGASETAPKVVALFGANASGKSNVLKALAFIAWFVRDSFSAPRDTRMPLYPFNDPEMLDEPTYLAIEIGGVEDITRIDDPEAAQCGYTYELAIKAGSETRVVSERLSYRPSWSARRIRLFERSPNGDVITGKAFGLTGYKQPLEKILRPNASVIATLAQLDHPYSKAIWSLANEVNCNILIEKIDLAEGAMIGLFAKNPHWLARANREIERIDLGIESFSLNPGDRGPEASFTHHGLALPMPLSNQSHGTRQFLKIFPYIASALDRGGLAVLDELDAAIHPLILPEIVRWFHDPLRNPKNAQLWMSCHNASVLEDLTKEEVYFVEKDSRGLSSVYGLRDVQSVRRNDNYYKKYLGGAFGAVPQIG
ncbi:AAA family ATPase [Methylobacterium pseudosasicola]|uniref:ATPase AAA-type core domain-containing protein n=1 Tax=Methylobacterium pseudosasicola TaxID=582667 RepID=A0A1I4FHX9_9HYPH|nr:ATP-binding protein [Methylobacterium pseudosasicola]SFL17565.1 hypothetical protein SAMN05192568_1001362 [Methylobacterium pseudosasicola]